MECERKFYLSILKNSLLLIMIIINMEEAKICDKLQDLWILS